HLGGRRDRPGPAGQPGGGQGDHGQLAGRLRRPARRPDPPGPRRPGQVGVGVGQGRPGGPPGTGPITLNPGQTGTIVVTITPSGASGTVVNGTLYIDDFDFFTDGGDELVALP